MNENMKERGAPRTMATAAALLVMLFVLMTSLDAVYYVTENRLPDWDEAGHLRASFTFYKTLSGEPGHPLQRLPEITWYPPAVYLLVQPFFVLWGAKLSSAYLAVSLLTHSLLLLSLFGLGRRLLPPEESERRKTAAGLLAALLGALSPGIYLFTRTFVLDTPLAAATAFGLYAAVRFAASPSRGTASLLVLATVLGTMTKWTYPVFAGPPLLLWVIWPPGGEAEEKGDGRRRRLLRLGAVLAVSFVLIAPYYYKLLPNIRHTFGFYRDQGQHYKHAFPPVLSAESLAYYFKDLYRYQLSPALFWLLLLALPGVALGRRSTLWPLVSGALVPYIFFTLLLNKNIRYTLPILPPLQLLAALGLFGLPRFIGLIAPRLVAARKWAGAVYRLACAALVFFALFQLLATSLFRLLPQGAADELSRFFPPWHFLRSWYRAADEDRDDFLAVAGAVLADRADRADSLPGKGGEATVLVCTNRPGFNASSLGLMAELRDMPLRFIGLDEADRVEDLVKSFQVGYVLEDSGRREKVYYLHERIEEAVGLVAEHGDKFAPLYRHALKDGSVLTLLRRTTPFPAFSVKEKKTKIEFDDGNLAARCGGLYFVEKWNEGRTVVWSKGKRTSLPFELRAAGEAGEVPALALEARLSSLPPPGAETRDVRVRLNGREVARWLVGRPWETYEALLAPPLLKLGVNLLSLHYGKPTRPCDVDPGSADCRDLAVVFDRLSFRVEQPVGPGVESIESGENIGKEK